MSDYEPLTNNTLPSRLGNIPEIADRLGGAPSTWQTREVGDGNLNLVFIVSGEQNTIVVKQALPYVRLVGESWPLSQIRAFFEYHALIRQDRMDPGSVPKVYYFNETQALIAMEYVTPHVILRHSFMQGIRHESLAQKIGQFAARTAFRSSDLSMTAAERKTDVALFAGNVELCDITENLVFTDPYFEAEQNRHTTPQLDSVVNSLRHDTELLVEAQHLKRAFCANAESLMHGDLHAGSIMAHENDIKIIDPEFAAYGPTGFDIGMCLGNLLMAYFSQSGHETEKGERSDYKDWILQLCADTWDTYRREYSTLWRSERNGILYPSSVFDAQGNSQASEQALSQLLTHIWQDLLGFAGVEMHRRILGIAHIIEFESIDDDARRAAGEEKALKLGRYLVVNRRRIDTMNTVMEMAALLEKEQIS